MADIRINVTGDGSGGSAVMKQSASEMEELGKAAKVTAAALVAMGAHALKSYSDSEKIQRQLTRAAGEYAGAIAEQSKALSQLYGIDDDIINQSAILLTQWGGAGAAARDVEVAALNLAAALGGDLKTATSDLIRNVESGGVGLAKLGIHFKATGDKSKDLEAAVAAINAKLGGAAKADADSLAGQAAAATVALGDLEKGFGQLIAAMLQKSNAITWVRDALASYQEVFFGNEAKEKAEAYTAMQTKLTGLMEKRASVENAITQAMRSGNMAEADKMVQRLARLDQEIEKMKEVRRLHNEGIGAGAPAVTGRTNKGLKDDAKVDVAAHQASSDAHDIIYKHEEESAEHKFDKLEKLRHDLAKSSEDGDIADEKRAAERAEKDAKEMAALEEKALKDQQDRAAKQAAAARAAGDQIGAAMVNALADQLAKLAEGGEFDAALFIGDILAAAVGVAGGVIGTAFGAPAVGAALGNLAAMGIRAGSSAISKSNKKAKRVSTYHDGGWVEPRYHDGAWIGADEQRAILQTGERVLSRREVSSMGGPAGVDSAVRRGGGLTLNVSAIDSKSMADTFAGSGADGLRQALKRGQGALPALLGGAMGGRGPR